jgi:hypothetical protein
METRVVTLRLVIRSRDFGKRRATLDRAVVIALAGAETALTHYGFRPTEMQAKVGRKRGEGQ